MNCRGEQLCAVCWGGVRSTPSVLRRPKATSAIHQISRQRRTLHTPAHFASPQTPDLAATPATAATTAATVADHPHPATARRTNTMATAAVARGAIQGTIKAGAARGALAVGDWASWTRTFEMAHVQEFARLSGDDNPVHLDAEYAAGTRFGRPIVHGMLYGSMIGTMFGAEVPGSIYLSQEFNFRKPVFVGDTVTARIEVIAARAKPHIVTCATSVVTQEGVEAMGGEARVLILRA